MIMWMMMAKKQTTTKLGHWEYVVGDIILVQPGGDVGIIHEPLLFSSAPRCGQDASKESPW